MTGPLVTLGLPVYRGDQMLPAILECLRTQTYPHLDILISIDAADQASAEVCRPFLAMDARFRMHVQASRLGWAGNTDWTIRNRRGEFYSYQQHDDLISPTYVEDLVSAALRWPAAAICFSKMVVSAKHVYAVRNKSVEAANPLVRALTHVERLDVGMLRGLIRSSLLGGIRVRTNAFEGFGSEQVFLTELAIAGEFRFVEGPVYYKQLHGKNLHLKWMEWPASQKRLAWAWVVSEIIGLVVPIGNSVPERRRIFFVILERFCSPRGALQWLRPASRWVHRQDFRGWSTPLRRIVELVRRGGGLEAWARTHSRTMLLDFKDARARARFSRIVLEELRNGLRFDPVETLNWTWIELEDAAAMHFGHSLRDP